MSLVNVIAPQPIKYSESVSNKQLGLAWGSVFYDTVRVSTGMDCSGKDVKVYFVPSSGSSTAWAIIDNIASSYVDVDLVRPTSGYVTGTVYVEVL